MCDLITHIEREIRAREAEPVTLPPSMQPNIEYTTDGVLVWQKVGADWVNITPGHVEPVTADSATSAITGSDHIEEGSGG